MGSRIGARRRTSAEASQIPAHSGLFPVSEWDHAGNRHPRSPVYELSFLLDHIEEQRFHVDRRNNRSKLSGVLYLLSLSMNMSSLLPGRKAR